MSPGPLRRTMSLLPGKKRAANKRPRIDSDWYVEPVWCSEQLFAYMQFEGPIFDPACGEGRIVEVAKRAGYEAAGSDIEDRGYGEVGVDFRKDFTPRKTIVANPPYGIVDTFLPHALEIATAAVAIIVPVPFLCGQERYWNLFRPCPPSYFLVCSQRPSMPPGGGLVPAKGGTTDYVWPIWSRTPLSRRRNCGLLPNGWVALAARHGRRLT